ncbi:MAG: DUF6171 family protein [Oscillospiraceae bacterium]|nr:DUF6171 family protein [Oscillospiraceae bacterium]
MDDFERVCRRCLLRDDSSQNDLFRSMSEYVASIPPWEKVSDASYFTRLEACSACANIISGICRICGCYVESRAAKRRMACPDVPSKWAADA